MNGTDREYLENFLMDIDILDELNSYLSNFNAFEILGVVNKEIRHSNVLGWLMDPNENHGLQDAFLKRLIQGIFYNFQEISQVDLTLFDLIDMNFNTFTVRREWESIDILVYSEAHNLVITIENKVWSKESKHQLKKYMKIVQEYFPEYHKMFLFLTPELDEPSDSVNWSSISYSFILEILDKAITLKKDTMNEAVKNFINQYREIVRRYIVGDKDLEEICRKIYYKHQKALDLIFEFKPDIYSDIAKYIEEKIESNNQLILDTSSKTYTRFISKNLEEIIPKVGQGWTNSNRLLLFEIENRNNRLMLKLMLGPGDSKMREAIFEMANRHRDTFQHIPKKLTDQYTQIYKTQLLPKDFEENMESFDGIRNEIDKNIDSFLNNKLAEIERIFEQEQDIFTLNI